MIPNIALLTGACAVLYENECFNLPQTDCEAHLRQESRTRGMPMAASILGQPLHPEGNRKNIRRVSGGSRKDRHMIDGRRGLGIKIFPNLIYELVVSQWCPRPVISLLGRAEL
jgi:hypothetical protein